MASSKIETLDSGRRFIALSDVVEYLQSRKTDAYWLNGEQMLATITKDIVAIDQQPQPISN